MTLTAYLSGAFARLSPDVRLFDMLVMAILFVTGLMGCQTIQDNDALARLTVKAATSEYIARKDDPQETARRISAIASGVQAFAEDNEVPVSELAEHAIKLIPGDIQPTTKILAEELVRLVADRLRDRLEESGQADRLLVIAEVMGWIHQAAVAYETEVPL